MDTLYVTDLDGTLLQNDATLSSFAREHLVRLLEKGLMFTIATARGITSTKQILGDLPLSLPIVEYNGAFVTDYQTGEHLISHDMAPCLKEGILNLLLENECPPFISSFDGTKDCLYYETIVNEGMAYYHEERTLSGDPRLHQIGSLEQSLQDQVVCFTIIQENPVAKDIQPILQHTFGDAIHTYRFDTKDDPFYWLTISDQQASKANGIQALRQHIKNAPNHLTVFGDNYNDISMFNLSDRAIAVQNARPEVQEHANTIIDPNTTNGVVKFIVQENPHL